MMAAATKVIIQVELTGLGKDQYFTQVATDGTTPTAATYNYRVLATTNTAEALDLGDISTNAILAIRAIDYDLDVDLDYVSAFDKDLTVKAGEPAALIPNPSGIVYVKNNGTDETPAYEYLIIGTT